MIFGPFIIGVTTAFFVSSMILLNYGRARCEHRQREEPQAHQHRARRGPRLATVQHDLAPRASRRPRAMLASPVGRWSLPATLGSSHRPRWLEP
jgi:hypothetical protein